MRTASRPHLTLAIAFVFAGFLAATPARAAEDKRACCRILRVDLEKSTVWLRNPRTALVVQFRLDADDRELFKVGDLFDPIANELNGTKLQKSFALVLPQLNPANAHILRVRGHEIAAKANDSERVYRFRTLKFDNVLSSLRPGKEVYADVTAGWIFVLYEGYGKVKPSVWAFELE